MTSVRNPARDQVAIVGVGRSPYSRDRPGCTPGSLVLEATVEAVRDEPAQPSSALSGHPDVDRAAGVRLDVEEVAGRLAAERRPLSTSVNSAMIRHSPPFR